MRMSDADNGEQKGSGRRAAEGRDARRSGRSVPTPADVFRGKRPAAPPPAQTAEPAQPAEGDGEEGEGRASGEGGGSGPAEAG